jgi:hypothetical protein
MRRALRPTLAVLALFALAACDTFEHRSKEKAATFSALDPQTQAKLERGIIELGQTEDMVYIALGRADDEFETTTAKGIEKTWIFLSYTQEFAGNHKVGYERVFVYNEKSGTYTAYLQPVYRNIFVERAEERLRITFRNGKVVAIEQPKSA